MPGMTRAEFEQLYVERIHADKFEELSGWNTVHTTRYIKKGVLRPAGRVSQTGMIFSHEDPIVQGSGYYYIYRPVDLKVALVINAIRQQQSNFDLFRLVADAIYAEEDPKYIVVESDRVHTCDTEDEAAKVIASASSLITVIQMENLL
jgi:hypothetical protein